MKNKKKNHNGIARVSPEHIYSELPDLHYIAIATLPADDALLIALQCLDIYEASATLSLTPRRRGKLYLRAAASYTEEQARLLKSNDSEFYEALVAARPQVEKQRKRSAKVTFAEHGELLLPTGCLVGSCYVDFDARTPREWRISRATLIDSFIQVPSRGGIYFLREAI